MTRKSKEKEKGDLGNVNQVLVWSNEGGLRIVEIDKVSEGNAKIR
jgi:hypothetical protein